MGGKLTTIGFDADDTLWQNEQFFRLSQERFAVLLADFTNGDHLQERLLDCEKRNLGHYGFGIKGFVLSMIETAIDVTKGQVSGSVIQELISIGQDMLTHPIELLPHAKDTVEQLSQTHTVLLVTKGDLLDQERKLAQSGLGDLFHGVEILSHKTPQAYRDVFHRHGSGPERAMMVGNSLRSDVNPAIQAGSWGVFVPHSLTGELEHDEPLSHHDRFFQINNLDELGDLVAGIG